ncbi:MAG: dephospho-CoA kinase [Treponema sp.]|nr:dephospho-CoA kinase [Treponema sp.]
MLIGLTGAYSAGKNHIASILEKKGLPVLDVDKLGYQALELEKEAVFTQFGEDLRKSDGSLDRRLLGQRVFGKPEKLNSLESIIHPVADRLVNEWITSQNRDCVINAALLHKSSIFNQIEHIFLVTAPFLTRFIRAKRRDKLPFKEIYRRFLSQKDFNAQYLSINAEIHRVENFGLLRSPGFMNLERRIDEILEVIKWKEK